MANVKAMLLHPFLGNLPIDLFDLGFGHGCSRERCLMDHRHRRRMRSFCLSGIQCWFRRCGSSDVGVPVASVDL